MHTTHNIEGRWPEGGSATFSIRSLKTHLRSYKELRVPSTRSWGGPYFDSKDQAVLRMWQLQAEIAFRDTLNSTPSTASWGWLRGATPLRHDDSDDWIGHQIPNGFDHSRIWVVDEGEYHRLGNRRHLVTTEPYHPDETIASCDKLGWPYIQMPWGCGLWYPFNDAGTHLFLVSPGKKGVAPNDLRKIADRLQFNQYLWCSNARWKAANEVADKERIRLRNFDDIQMTNHSRVQLN